MNEYVPMDWTTQESWLKVLVGERHLFQLQSIQTNFQAHPTLYLLGNGGILPLGIIKLTTYLHPVQKLRMSETVPLLHMPLWHAQRQLYFTCVFFTHPVILEYLCEDYI